MEPTHRQGGTLDHIMTFADFQLDEISVDPAGIIPDHSLLTADVDPAPTTQRLVRAWRRADRDSLRRALEASQLCQPVSPDAAIDELFDTYDWTMRDIADRFAPLHTLRRRGDRRTPWFDADCREARRVCRRCERRYRRSRSVTD